MSNQSLKRFFVMYISFFICLLIVFIPAYILFYESYKKNTLEIIEQTLKNGIAAFENDLSTFSGTCMSFFDTADASHIFFYRPPLSDSQLYRLDLADKRFSDAMRYISLREDVGYILSERIILSYKRMHTDKADFYGRYLRYADYDTFDSWFDMLTDFDGSMRLIPERTIMNIDRTYEGITCVLRLPLNVNAKLNNHILFMTMNADTLVKKLLPPEALTSGSLSFTDSSGQVLLNRPGSPDADYATVSVEGRLYGLKVTAGIDKALFGRKLAPLTRLGFVFIAAYVLAGIALSVFYSYHSSKPLNALIRAARNIGPLQGLPPEREAAAKGGYSYVEHVLSQTGHAMSDYEKELSRQTEQLRYYTLNSILNGQIFDDAEYKNAREFFDSLSELSVYQVGVLSFPPEDTVKIPGFSAKLVRTASLICQAMGENAITHVLQNSIVIILPEDACGDEEKLAAMVESVRAFLSMPCRLYISGVYTGMENLSRAYNQAKTLSRIYSIHEQDSHVLSADDEAYGDEPVFTDLIDPQRLYELIVRMQEAAAQSMLSEASGKITSMGLAEEEHVRCIFYSCLYVLIRIQNEFKLAEFSNISLPVYDPHISVSELFRRLAGAASAFCGMLREMHSNEDKQKELEVVRYIDDNFSDPDMYLRSVTQHLNLSENNLQRIMRNVTGKSFFDYLEQKRLEYARTLLQTTDLPLSKIITSCGYNSQNAFYKAFKKRFDVSPSVMRGKTQ